MSQPSDSTTPITTPASTPDDSTPRIAATAIQKSNRATRRSRRSSADVDHPEHDGVDDHRAQDRLRQVGEQRREHQQREQHEPARDQRRHRRPGAGGLVQRARREARRDRHALEDARAGVRHPLRHGLLVDVDAVPVPGGERAGVAGRLREPDQHQRDAATTTVAMCSRPARGRAAPASAARSARRRRARPRARPRSSRRAARIPATTSTSAPGTAGARKRSPRISAERERRRRRASPRGCRRASRSTSRARATRCRPRRRSPSAWRARRSPRRRRRPPGTR